MEPFAAVVTTGIYCRPGCSAQPRAENVRTFALAAAAEAAGYRACLRCRPYRWPQALTCTAPELVCRAVRLILDGALDRGSESELGARVGVSPRHLRRLFATHLGVTPDGLARSARVHFARRLLDDTDLTVTEIAFAAGFGSLRQFNRACREVFRESPLTTVGLTHEQIRAIRSFARAVVDDAVRLDRSASLDELIASLTALEGLNSWTAHYVALRLGEPDACPTPAAALRRAIPRHARLMPAASGDPAERWRPWRALATTHLWIAAGGQEAPLAPAAFARGAA